MEIVRSLICSNCSSETRLFSRSLRFSHPFPLPTSIWLFVNDKRNHRLESFRGSKIDSLPIAVLSFNFSFYKCGENFKPTPIQRISFNISEQDFLNTECGITVGQLPQTLTPRVIVMITIPEQDFLNMKCGFHHCGSADPSQP